MRWYDLIEVCRGLIIIIICGSSDEQCNAYCPICRNRVADVLQPADLRQFGDSELTLHAL
jgi:hypothetical protein